MCTIKPVWLQNELVGHLSAKIWKRKKLDIYVHGLAATGARSC